MDDPYFDHRAIRRLEVDFRLEWLPERAGLLLYDRNSGEAMFRLRYRDWIDYREQEEHFTDIPWSDGPRLVLEPIDVEFSGQEEHL